MDVRTHFIGTWEISILSWSRVQDREGKVEDTEALDARNREVRSGHSSKEGSEQGRDSAELLERRPRPEGKIGRSYHMPYTEMGTCVPLDQTTTASRCRHARECDPREEPYALARTYGSVRGARGNPGPYRDQCSRTL